MKVILYQILLVFFSCAHSMKPDSTDITPKDYTIEIGINNFTDNTISLFRNNPIEPKLIQKISRQNESEPFVFNGAMTEGQYVLEFGSKPNEIYFFVNNNESDFKINLDAKAINAMSFERSKDNTNYLNYLTEKQKLRNEFSSAKLKTSGNTKDPKYLKAIANLDKCRNDYASSKANGVSKYWVKAEGTNAVRSELVLQILEQKADFDKSAERYLSHLDFSGDVLSSSSFLLEKLDVFLEKMTPQNEESLQKAIDKILGKAENAPQIFQYLQQGIRRKYKNPRNNTIFRKPLCLFDR